MPPLFSSRSSRLFARRRFTRGLTTLAILLSLYAATNLYAQKPALRFEQLTTEEGLSSNSIQCVLQDSKGFMWIGTFDGLNKYDGSRFAVYRNDPDDPNSLSNIAINALYEDHTGVVWVGTADGLNRFDRDTETFTRYRHDPNDTLSLSNDWINVLAEDHAGALWVGTKSGLNRFDPETETFTRYFFEDDASNRITALYVDRAGVLWVGTRALGAGGLYRFNHETETFTRYTQEPDDPNSFTYPAWSKERTQDVWKYLSFHENQVTFIYEDRTGRLWIGTLIAGLKSFDRQTETFTHYVLNPSAPENLVWVRSIHEDHAGRLWIGTWSNGLYRMNRDAETFTRYRHDPNNPHSLASDGIRSIHADGSGALWVGTGGGLSKLDTATEAFAHYRRDTHEPRSLSDNTVWALLEDRSGALWIGSDDGLHQFDRATGTVILSKNMGTLPGTPGTHGAAQSGNNLIGRHVLALYEDRAGTLWVGTAFAGGLHRFDRRTQTFRIYYNILNDPHSYSGAFVKVIYEDRDGVLWIGDDRDGLNRFNRETETFTVYRHDPDDPNSLGHDGVEVLYEDRAGTFWIGTNGGGLDRLDRATETFTHYRHDPDDPNSLSHNHIYALYEDRAGTFWIGTNGGGLNRFDRETEAFTAFRQKDGLPNDIVYGILEDDHGNLWLSTGKGLSRFDLRTETFPDGNLRFRNYDAHDGLQGDDFNAGAYHKSARTGEMYFGGRNGFNVFHPDNLQDNLLPPRVAITGFRRFNEPVAIGADSPLKKHISETDALVLSYADKVLTFEFSALHYADPARNQYAYMLEGFDEDWQYVGNKQDVTYTNLDPGRYVFRVKAANKDGVWNEEGTSLRMTITPPWWRTTWAYVLYGVLFLAGVFAVDRVQRRRLMQKGRDKARIREARLKAEAAEAHARVLEELDAMKTRFFANVSHEFRTPLTLTIGPLEDLLAKDQDIRLADVAGNLDLSLRNARRLLRLTNQILDVARLESGRLTLHRRRVDLVAFVEGIALAFEPLAGHKRIAFHVETPQEALAASFDPDQLEKVFTNLLSNAFKFTPEGGAIRLRVAPSETDGVAETATVAVRNSGPGIPADKLAHVFERFYRADESSTQAGTGIGLSLVEELVELHGGTVTAESEAGFSTTFTVRLPLAAEAVEAEAVSEAPASEAATLVSDLLATQQAEDAAAERAVAAEETREAREDVTTILVVEDSAEMRSFIRDHLEPRYRVVEAANGAAGLETARRVLPDVIVSDVMMPEMDGFALCRALKQDPSTDFIPVILLTARASSDDKMEGLLGGADAYLTKPFDERELAARVENLMAARRRLQAHWSKRPREMHVGEVEIVSTDEAFLAQVQAVVEAHLSEGGFGVQQLADAVGQSRTTLFRRLRDLLGKSPTEMIRAMRMERAAQLLQGRAGSISEVAYGLGYQSVSHFSKCFRETYGVTPSEFVTQETMNPP